MSNIWGYSTSIDLKKCNGESIRSARIIREYVKKLIELIDMKAYGLPEVVKFGESEDVKGYTLVQLIETSLISAHFVDKDNSAYIDIFSCKDYDSNIAAVFSQNFFEASEMVFQRLSRGNQFNWLINAKRNCS